jgi:hypothetical protein
MAAESDGHDPLAGGAVFVLQPPAAPAAGARTGSSVVG